MVNRSLNLTKHAQTKGINTITLEQLISNVSEQLAVNISTDENYTLDDFYDLLPSEITQYFNSSMNISANDLEDILLIIDTLSSDLLSNMTMFTGLDNLSSDDELVHQISTILKHGSSNIT